MPGPPKSPLKTLRVSKAGAASNCHHDKKHRFTKGDTLLEVKVNRDRSRLCVPCALESVRAGIRRLKEIEAELESA